jgi:hypothetical protein
MAPGLVKNIIVKPSGKVVVLGRHSAGRNLKDAELLLRDAGKLLRRRELNPADFATLEARLVGVLCRLEEGLGALGIPLEPTG